MTKYLVPSDVANSISALISRNPLWANKVVYLFLISNETAGCFKDKKKALKYKKLFSQAEQEMCKIPSCVKSIQTKLFSTKYAGHAKELAQAITAEIIGLKEKNAEYILATAGGDGTSLEVQTTLFKAAQSNPLKRDVIMNKLTILRLPLGTGNDGTDGHTVEQTIDLLKSPLHFENARAIKVYPEGNPTPEQIAASGKKPEHYCDDPEFTAPWYAFNVAGMGLDAYVCYMTNYIKKHIPGNFYHLAVDLSGLVYDRKFEPGTGVFEYYDEKGRMTLKTTTQIEIFNMAPSGHRYYGGGHLILPDDNNTCLTYKISLPRLIVENKHFVDGSHINRPDLAKLYSAEKVRIFYDKPILIQCDGETALVCKEHFPLVMEKTSPCLRIIKPNAEIN